MSGERQPPTEAGFRLARVAALATRRSRLLVAVWLVAIAALALLGRNLAQELKVSPIFVEGSQSKRAHELSLRGFGGEHAIVVLLRGPEKTVERQGRELARRLGRSPGMLVVSPWNGAAEVEELRPAPRVAALVVRTKSTAATKVNDLLPPVERQVEAVVKGPVRASIAGFPALVDSVLTVSDRATKVAELIALPVLLVVLLLVFRSVLAALIPLVMGGTVVAASQGILSVVIDLVEIQVISLSLLGMMGLALGVDYSLLVVSRFREERRRVGTDLAAQMTVRAVSRSILPAGCGLLIAMLVSALVLPGEMARSVAIAVSVATLLSMLSALCVTPALLTLFGDNLDRWSLRAPRAAAGGMPAWSRRVVRRPRAVAAMVVLMLALSGWAFTLRSGLAGIDSLPAGDPGRIQQEDVERALGPGWIAPAEVIVDGNGAPVTSPERLRSLTAFQRKVERHPGVRSVAGFDRIERGAGRLRAIERGLAEQRRGLERLGEGISRAHRGARLNTDGLRGAAGGADALNAGIGAAGRGSQLLASALGAVGGGTARLRDGLAEAGSGSGELVDGTATASAGATRLAEGLKKARGGIAEIEGSTRLLERALLSGSERLTELHDPLRTTGEQLSAAMQALARMTVGREDPQYGVALGALEEASRAFAGGEVEAAKPVGAPGGGIEAGVERAEGQLETGLYLSSQLEEGGSQADRGIEKLARGSARLDRGLRRLLDGSRRLADGIATLARGGGRLDPALVQLQEGAERLAGGLGRLEDGSDRLAAGLNGGARKSSLLTGGLRRIGLALERREEEGGGGLEALRRQSPGLFRSGYFALAGLDGSPPALREQLGSLVNLDRGGGYARMLVVPTHAAISEQAGELKRRLEDDAVALAAETGAEVAVGGVAPATVDANEALRGEALPLRLLLSLVSFLVLLPVLRSLLLPLLAALINLITVSAVFGLLALLFNASLLGGPGYVDSLVIPAAMIVLFGLAIDYEVFVFARMREEYLRTGSTRAAIENGLGKTAHVVTGAALIMIAVFLAFSISSVMLIRNIGIALAIGVFLDAFVVRLIVIPALMERLGRWNWWLPGWLDRLLPGGTQHAPEPQRTGPARA